MVGNPCPMQQHFHTILGLMDAQDPLLSCEHHCYHYSGQQPAITQLVS